MNDIMVLYPSINKCNTIHMHTISLSIPVVSALIGFTIIYVYINHYRKCDFVSSFPSETVCAWHPNRCSYLSLFFYCLAVDGLVQFFSLFLFNFNVSFFFLLFRFFCKRNIFFVIFDYFSLFFFFWGGCQYFFYSYFIILVNI